MPSVFDLVEQTSTTTGTGAYDMTGTVTGRRAFSLLSGGAVVPYAAVDDAGGYELGFGTWTGTPKKLSRTIVLTSSNANAAVSWAAGTRRVYIAPHGALLSLAAVRHSLDETSAAPDVTDDSASGYGPGSHWISTDDAAWICVDASPGAAKWIPIFKAAPGSYTDEIRLPIAVLMNGENAIPYSARGLAMESAVPGALGYGNVGQWSAATSDATPVNMTSSDGNDVVINRTSGNGVVALKALVCASQNTAAGERKAWELTCAIKQVSGTLTVGTVTATELMETAGATGWSVTVVVDSGKVYIQVTGAAATDIVWEATFMACTSNVQAF